MLVVAASTAVHAKCRVADDRDFATAGGGCKDLSTGLVWSPDLRAFDGISDEGQAQNSGQLICDQFLNSNLANGGGFTDWRVPTVGEIQEAIDNGLNSHLDFFLNGSPDDFKYRWTACTKKIKRFTYRYIVRFADGVTQLPITISGRPDTHLICVRGLPADTANDCPDKTNNRSRAMNTLSQTYTGALLLVPLAVVLAARCLRLHRTRPTHRQENSMRKILA
jgi:hypothetical protein